MNASGPSGVMAAVWTEVRNRSRTASSYGNRSRMVDPDLLTGQVSHTPQQQLQNGSATAAAATRPSDNEDFLSSSGIIPGAIAATLFIAFLLVLYAILWKCMVSAPQRKHRKIRPRLHQKTLL